MDTENRGQHSAAPSALGYFYQCRYALLDSLLRLPEGDRFCISIETLDDVVFERDGSATEVLQTKHHINTQARLTDASPDLWKTLRIWINGWSDGSIPRDTKFFLITTALCSEGTAASYLRPNDRDEKKAIERLKSTALSSKTEANASSYEAFRAFGDKELELLISSITIFDA